jgi:putative ABC transport system substrate-binding protein
VISRRAFLASLTGGVLASPLAVASQPAGKVYRIGVLSTTGPEQENFIWTDLRRVLRERGWVEGQNLAIEWHYAEGRYERLADMAAELVRLKPDLIMARGRPGATAAKRATAAIPIVMYNATDPVGIGLVESLARPGTSRDWPTMSAQKSSANGCRS